MTSFSNLGLNTISFENQVISGADNVTRKWLDNDYYVLPEIYNITVKI